MRKKYSLIPSLDLHLSFFSATPPQEIAYRCFLLHYVRYCFIGVRLEADPQACRAPDPYISSKGKAKKKQNPTSFPGLGRLTSARARSGDGDSGLVSDFGDGTSLLSETLLLLDRDDFGDGTSSLWTEALRLLGSDGIAIPSSERLSKMWRIFGGQRQTSQFRRANREFKTKRNKSSASSESA